MARNDDKIEWDKLKQGHLEGEQADEFGLFSRGRAAPGMVAIPSVASFRPRQIAKVSVNPELHTRLRALKFGSTANVGYSPFHLHVARVSRAALPKIPASVRRGTHVIISPKKQDVRRVIELGATRNWRCRAYTLPQNHPFLKTPEGAAMAHSLSFFERASRLHGKSEAQSIREAKAFQVYIERARADEDTRKEEVEHDKRGPTSFGNLGQTLDLRLSFWDAIDRMEKRADAILQFRLDAELPYWISPEDRREIVERFVKIFEENGLGYWAAVHLPDVEGGSDPRNIHLHIIWFDRPVKRFGTVDIPFPEFEEKKARECRGADWIALLRRRYADIANDVILKVAERDKQLPIRLLHPGTYESIGIFVTPQAHEGPARTALRRAGKPTRVTQRNLSVERLDQDIRAAAAMRKIDDMIALHARWSTDILALQALKNVQPYHSAHVACNFASNGLNDAHILIFNSKRAASEWEKRSSGSTSRHRMILLDRLEREAAELSLWASDQTHRHANIAGHITELTEIARAEEIRRNTPLIRPSRPSAPSREIPTRIINPRTTVRAPAGGIYSISAPVDVASKLPEGLFKLLVAAVTASDANTREQFHMRVRAISETERRDFLRTMQANPVPATMDKTARLIFDAAMRLLAETLSAKLETTTLPKRRSQDDPGR